MIWIYNLDELAGLQEEADVVTKDPGLNEPTHVPTGRRTRGVRIDYSKMPGANDPDDDEEEEEEEEEVAKKSSKPSSTSKPASKGTAPDNKKKVEEEEEEDEDADADEDKDDEDEAEDE